ncbi:OmpA family protein [Desulfuromonas sp. CSMB_57]|uniref:OmpA family protein n=1 Tax=Desulfuromonas sp. CSMB_57 TaxID=2807629 RepID=UPI001CD2374A|nr:OmpA family protein [Desulfuromonas sp. CSMB_57]
MSRAMRSYLLLAVLFVAVLQIAPAEAAKRSKGDFSISPMVGGFSFDSSKKLADDLTVSLGLGYNISDSWSTEFVLNYFNTEGQGTQRGTDVDGYAYRFDTLYHFLPHSSLVPYLAGGIGGITLDRENRGSETDLLLNYGFGLKYFLTDSLALRGDLRHVYTFPDNNFVYTAGLTYHFGGPKPSLAGDAASPLLDSDGDGVPDRLDRCPGTPRGTKVDAHGCPVKVPVREQRPIAQPAAIASAPAPTAEISRPATLALAIEFDANRAAIKPGHHQELRRAAEFVRKNPTARVLIAGHTDAQGAAADNLALSQRRAESVRRYLMETFNLDGTRLVARGYGESRPIADNGTSAGRRRNRRVELSVLPD